MCLLVLDWMEYSRLKLLSFTNDDWKFCLHALHRTVLNFTLIDWVRSPSSDQQNPLGGTAVDPQLLRAELSTSFTTY